MIILCVNIWYTITDLLCVQFYCIYIGNEYHDLFEMELRLVWFAKYHWFYISIHLIYTGKMEEIILCEDDNQYQNVCYIYIISSV